MSGSQFVVRGGTAAAAALVVLVLLMVSASVAAAVPGTVTGITSSTHPGETTWYSSDSPSFAWEPALADGTAIAGYSCVLDRSRLDHPGHDERPQLAHLSAARGVQRGHAAGRGAHRRRQRRRQA